MRALSEVRLRAHNSIQGKGAHNKNRKQSQQKNLLHAAEFSTGKLRSKNAGFLQAISNARRRDFLFRVVPHCLPLFPFLFSSALMRNP
jgi:hypothetical protein